MLVVYLLFSAPLFCGSYFDTSGVLGSHFGVSEASWEAIVKTEPNLVALVPLDRGASGYRAFSQFCNLLEMCWRPASSCDELESSSHEEPVSVLVPIPSRDGVDLAPSLSLSLASQANSRPTASLCDEPEANPQDELVNFATPKPSKDGEDFASLPQASRTISQPTLKPSEYGEDLDLSFSQASIYNCRFRACSQEAIVAHSDVISN